MIALEQGVEMKTKNKIISFVLTEQKADENVPAVLVRILRSKKKTSDFLGTIINNPRDNREAYRYFCNSFKASSERRQWYNVYANAYMSFMKNLMNDATCIEDLLRILPNLAPWVLEHRFGNIKIGNIPDAFVSEDSFLSLVLKISRSKAVAQYRRIKRFDGHLAEFRETFPEVKKIDWFDAKARYGFLKELLQKECGKPFVVKQDGRCYRVTYLCNPFSCKMVFEIKTPENETFILKSSPYLFMSDSDRVRQERENMAIRADSVYSNALLDFYLKLNDCQNVADILYYRFNYEVSLYRAEKGKPLHKGISKNKYLDFYSFNSETISDANCLGVYANDISKGNFLVSQRDGQVKIIDIGHASFVNPLTPEVSGLTFTFGNLCARNFLAIDGVLEMDEDTSV